MTDRTGSRRQLVAMMIAHPIGMLIGAVVGGLVAYAIVYALETMHPGIVEAYGFRDFNALAVVVLWCFLGAVAGSSIIGAMAIVWVLKHTEKPLARGAGRLLFGLDLVAWGLIFVLLIMAGIWTTILPFFIGVFVVAVPALVLRWTGDRAESAQ